MASSHPLCHMLPGTFGEGPAKSFYDPTRQSWSDRTQSQCGDTRRLQPHVKDAVQCRAIVTVRWLCQQPRLMSLNERVGFTQDWHHCFYGTTVIETAIVSVHHICAFIHTYTAPTYSLLQPVAYGAYLERPCAWVAPFGGEKQEQPRVAVVTRRRP